MVADREIRYLNGSVERKLICSFQIKTSGRKSGSQFQGPVHMRKIILPLIPILAVGLGAATNAQAQSQSNAPDPVGETHLAASADLEELFDSNVARSSLAVAESRGIVRSDERTDLDLNVDYLKAIGRQSVFLKGFEGYNWYSKDTILNRQSGTIDGGVDLRIASCQSVLSDTFDQHQSDLVEINTPQVQNTRSLNTIDFNGDCARPIGFTPIWDVNQSQSHNGNSSVRENDYHSVGGQLGLAYLRPSLGRISLSGSYSTNEYTNRVFLINGSRVTDQFDVYGAVLAYSRNVGARLSITSNVSYMEVDQNISGSKSFRGLTYGLDLNLLPIGRLSGELSAERIVAPSTQIGSTFTVKNDYLATVNYAVNSKITATLGGSYSDQKFSGYLLNSGTELTHQKLPAVYSSLKYEMSRRLTLLLDVRNEERQSNLGAFGYSSNQVSLTLTLHN